MTSKNRATDLAPISKPNLVFRTGLREESSHDFLAPISKNSDSRCSAKGAPALFGPLGHKRHRHKPPRKLWQASSLPKVDNSRPPFSRPPAFLPRDTSSSEWQRQPQDGPNITHPTVFRGPPSPNLRRPLLLRLLQRQRPSSRNQTSSTPPSRRSGTAWSTSSIPWSSLCRTSPAVAAPCTG